MRNFHTFLSARKPSGASSLPIPVIIGIICFCASVPHGSVTGWAHNLLIIACTALALASAWRAGKACGPDSPSYNHCRISLAARVILLALVAWVVFQTIPLPVSHIVALQPGAKAKYGMLFDPSTRVSIGFDLHSTLISAATWAAFGLLAWTAARCSLSGRNGARILTVSLVAAGTAQALAGLAKGPGTASADMPWTGHLMGTFLSPSAFGGFLAITLPLTLALIFDSMERFVPDNEKRPGPITFLISLLRKSLFRFLLLTLVFIIQWCAILLSASRGAIIATVLAQFALAYWYARRAENIRKISMFGVTMAALFLVLIMGIGGTYSAMTAKFSELSSLPETLSLVSRLHMWGAAIGMLIAHPLGVGLGCFSDAFPAFQPSGFERFRLDFAHNDFLQIACELGIPGTILLISAAVFTRREIARQPLATDCRGLWLRRGGVVAVAAGLMNCLTEFNLTSRPAVAAIFFASAGLAWPVMSSPEPAKEAPKRDLALMSVIRRCIFSGLCVAICIFALIGGVSSWLRDTAWISISGVPNPYFWFDANRVSPESAIKRLKAASLIMPMDFRNAYCLAMSGIELLDSERERAKTDAARDMRTVNRAHLMQAIRVATREKEVSAMRKALPLLEKASRHSPWNPDIYSALAQCSADLLVDESDTNERHILYRRFTSDSDKALMLAPNDTTILPQICDALSCVIRSGIEPQGGRNPAAQLRELGARALRLNRENDRRVLQAWHMAGFNAAFILAGQDLPPDSLWRIYAYYDRNDDGDSCLACLKTIRTALNNPSLEYASYVTKTGNTREGEYWGLLTREESKWFLRLCRWSSYNLISKYRTATYARKLEQKFNTRNVKEMSPSVLLLLLRQTDKETGLTIPWSFELCDLEASRGVPAEASRKLAELSLVERSDLQSALNRFLKVKRANFTDYGMLLAQTRADIFAGKRDKALTVMSKLLEKQNGVPLSIRHRVRYAMAQCELGENRPDKAAELLFNSAAECPTDQDTLGLLVNMGFSSKPFKTARGRETTASELLSEIEPSYRIGSTYMGGKIELLGFDVSPNIRDNLRGETIIRSFWRFYGSTPADLEAMAMLADSSGKTLCSRRKSFNSYEPLLFCAGSPRIGSVIVMENVLPAPCLADMRLMIGLSRSSRGWIQNAEGLWFAEMWNPDKLCREPAKPVAP